MKLWFAMRHSHAYVPSATHHVILVRHAHSFVAVHVHHVRGAWRRNRLRLYSVTKLQSVLEVMHLWSACDFFQSRKNVQRTWLGLGLVLTMSLNRSPSVTPLSHGQALSFVQVADRSQEVTTNDLSDLFASDQDSQHRNHELSYKGT